MPRDSEHDCSGQDCHDHTHDQSDDLGPQDNLYTHIDRQNVVALNIGDYQSSSIIKPWHQRMDESLYIESEADDEIIVRVPFTGSVRLRAILLKAGPAPHTPSKVLLFANDMNLDFDDAADRVPTQEVNIVETRQVGEYAIKTAKFSNVSSISLYFPSRGPDCTDTTRIYYLGFLGYWSERKDKPVITVYEAQPNISDHEKIQGTEGNFSAPQM
ncbi:hypothetical protein AX14_014326 [Amanita brunnescens Koide BX004]|nr:hypothetical protein AX14_014326 [Amanita brunnescens Koide BX004]